MRNNNNTILPGDDHHHHHRHDDDDADERFRVERGRKRKMISNECEYNEREREREREVYASPKRYRALIKKKHCNETLNKQNRYTKLDFENIS